MTFEDESRYTPVRSGQIHQGIIILKDSTPDQPEDLIEIAPAAKGASRVDSKNCVGAPRARCGCASVVRQRRGEGWVAP